MKTRNIPSPKLFVGNSRRAIALGVEAVRRGRGGGGGILSLCMAVAV